MVRSGCWMNEIVIWNFGVFNEKWGCLTHAVVLLCWHFFSHWNYQGTDCLTPNNNIILVKKWKCSQCCSLIVTRSGGNWLKCSGESVGFLLFSFTGSHSEFTLNGWLFFLSVALCWTCELDSVYPTLTWWPLGLAFIQPWTLKVI